MGKEARIGLLVGAAACLLAVMVSWIVEELREQESTDAQDTMAESAPKPAATKESAPAEPAPDAPVTATS